MKKIIGKKYNNIVFFGIIILLINVIFFGYNINAQKNINLQLEIKNSFSASGYFSTGSMVKSDDFWYTSNLVQLYLNSNSGSQYQITGDIFPFVFGSGEGAYSIQKNVYLTGNDGQKVIYLQFYKNWSGGYYIEKINSGPFELILDNTSPNKVDLQNPENNSNINGLVNFKRSISVDTGVGFLEYTYSFSNDSGFNNIVYAGITTDNGTIFNVNSVLGSGKYYWRVASEDKLGNVINSNINSFVIGDENIVKNNQYGGSSTRPYYTIPFDDCPNGDFSVSYYDHDCGIPGNEDYTYGHNSFGLEDDLMNAYKYAYKYGITTMGSYEDANMTGEILRKQLAKMLSQFAINILGKEPNINTGCRFDDIDNISEEFQYYAVVSCQLGIMGLTYDGYPDKSFNPNLPVPRSQFATTLSRLIFGGTFNGNSKNRYADHMHALKRANIMTYISNPYMIELRGYVMLMLMRTDQNNYVNAGSLEFLK